MPEAAVKYEEQDYAEAVYGTAVPNKSREIRQPEEQPVRRPRKRKAEEALPLPQRRRVSVPSVAGFLIIITLAGIFLTLYAQLTAAMSELYATRPVLAESAMSGDRTVGLATMRDELLDRAKELRVEFERTFDLGEIEAYAIEHLGMVKAPQREGRNGAVPSDRAVIPSGVNDDESILDKVLEYFGIG